MHLFTYLHYHFIQAIDRLRADDEQNQSTEEIFLQRLKDRQHAKQRESKAQRRRWQPPIQRSTSAKTIFTEKFRRKEAKRFWSRPKDPEAANTAWDGLSIDEQGHYATLAKQNQVYNTNELAKFNSRCPLSPSVEDLTYVNTLANHNYVADVELYARRLYLQNWNRYRFDHPRACGGALTPVPETPFRFTDLPFELRREIFVYVLRRPNPVRQLRPDGSADLRGGPIDVRIFAVSRAVFADAVRVFYEENTFALNPADRRYRTHLPLFVSQSTRDQAPRPTDSIKRMQVDLEVRPAGSTFSLQIDGKPELWEQLCAFLKNCKNLRKIEVTVWCKEFVYKDYRAIIDEKIDKLFEMLREIRSADEVVFSDATTIHQGIQFIPSYCGRQITGIIVRPSGGITLGSVEHVQDWIWPVRPCCIISGFPESYR